MGLDTVVIKITKDTKDIDKTIKQLQSLKKVDKENAKSFEKTNKKLQEEQKKSKKSVEGLKTSLTSLGPIILGAFSVAALTSFTKAVVSTRAEFQKLAAVLTNTLGSRSAAQKALKDIKEFAAKTPFSVLELTDSFVKLANQGFKPTSEEMRKLGDLASSTGKSFDQLAEAIIDAQVGEFERLKEFGIRAQKQGDRVTFTFKGVKEQVDFTEKSIRKYVLSLGDAAGVSGAMAAISATLGGQISNAGDAYDSFLDSLGERGEGIFSAAISSVVDLIQGLEEFVKIPVSDKLEEERIALNLLILKITDTNIKQEDRNTLINELQEEYPDFLKNIKQEEINNALLTTRLKEVNEQLINRIIIQTKQEEIDEINQKLAKIRISALKRQDELINTLLETSKRFGFELLDQGTLTERVASAQKELQKQFNKFGIAVDSAKRASKDLSGQLANLNSLNKSGVDIGNEVLSLLSAKTELMIKLGIATEEVVVVKKEENEETKTSKTAIEILVKLIADLKKELINQALAGDISTETIKELREATDRLISAEVDLKIALSGTLEPMEAQRLKLLQIKDVAFSASEELKKQQERERKEIEDTRDVRLDAIGKVSEAAQSASRILDQISINRVIKIDNEESKQLKALESEALGEEELAKKKLEIQEKSDEERAKVLTDQAKKDKIAAIFDASINTAIAVTKALASTANPIFAAFIGGLGLIEIAAIAAQPIPTFHEGKKADLKHGEIYAKILESESVIPPDQSKKYKGPIDAMIDKRFEHYVFQEYMLPIMKSMGKGGTSNPYDDIHIWNNQKKQIQLMTENNALTRSLIRSMESGNHRRSWS